MPVLQMPLTAFSPFEGIAIFSWIISTGIFSHNNRRLAFNVSDDILINTRGYTIFLRVGVKKK